jgi:hypothetical protein
LKLFVEMEVPLPEDNDVVVEIETALRGCEEVDTDLIHKYEEAVTTMNENAASGIEAAAFDLMNAQQDAAATNTEQAQETDAEDSMEAEASAQEKARKFVDTMFL